MINSLKLYALSLIFIFSIQQAALSQVKTDTTTRLREVVIKPYFNVLPLLRSTGAVGVLDQESLQQQNSNSLVPAMNTISGIRMEERSPGSYRLSIRGSLLRSPFGIRNVKIYMDEFPLTDAGGNTYLNALDVSAIGSIQVLKGPQSSIFGANSGGVVLINPAVTNSSPSAALHLEKGSFGAFHEDITLGNQWGKYQATLTQSYQRSDGYRDNSAMKRNFVQLVQQLNYLPQASLKALIFYSDLGYQTPGGLTAAQMELNPRMSRPAAGAIKSAVQQQAGIYSKTLYGGVANDWQLGNGFRHVIAVFGSYTDLKNPFITNYEHRKETTFGARTYLDYLRSFRNVNYKFDVGVESSGTSSDVNNFVNNLGTPGAVMASDKLRSASNFVFLNLSMDLNKRLLLEFSGSANFYKYHYETLAPVPIAERTNKFDMQLMPRAALSYLFDPRFSVRGSVSRGYSPPTQAEVRASDNVINITLQPESGWNREIGFKYQDLSNTVSADITGFYYSLNQAIVRRLNTNDTEYFINAGGTKQLGVETALSAWIIKPRGAGFFKGMQLRNAVTLSNFKFKEYQVGAASYNGNALTGVPKNIFISSLSVDLPQSIYAFVQHNYTSRIPLNDGNTVYANKYHLLQARIGWKNIRIAKTRLELYAGADNLLNQKYSLGNDLNAANNRYFNPAATRSFYGGLIYKLAKM
ncbi:MAG: TonB-dependent receptor [Pedobacter sp.]|nr:MAG: TonB-dependent receptor [Pedobacter sp.]